METARDKETISRADKLPDSESDAQNEIPPSELLERLHGDPNQSRIAGNTEHNWCRTVSGGTGVTVLAIRMQGSPDAPSPTALQAALRSVQEKHPLLRSRLVWINGSPAISVSLRPFIELSVLQPPAPDTDTALIPQWMQIVETELNDNSGWEEKHHCLDPVPMVTARLYVNVRHEPPASDAGVAPTSVLVLRLHTAMCDRASAATIYKDLILSIKKVQKSSDIISNDNSVDYSSNPVCSAADNVLKMRCVEDLIPKGMANKPFWARGIDILGYSLGSMRHAMLPFEDTQVKQRRSQVLCRKLDAGETQKLLQDCAMEKTNLLGVLTAAVLKATAKLKNLEDGVGESYAVVTFVNCRSSLEPVLSASTVGFYHSAILNRHTIRGDDPFWETSRKCSLALETSVKKRKHFTDMNDLLMLMSQAMRMPHLTPSSSLRTATLSFFDGLNSLDFEEDSMISTIQQELGVQEYLTCSSVHGVGPSIGIFHHLQNGELHLTCVFPSPLHSYNQVSHLMNIAISMLM